MYSSLEDVEFLARSESRVRVLDALDEEPQTRDELREATEASRTTLSRMLADFEEREWIVRSNGRFELTPEGAFVASEIIRLLENMGTAEKLDGTLGWLPTDEFDFDLRHLHDAEVVTLRWNDPVSMRQLAGRLEDASRVWSIDASVSREFVDVLRKLTLQRCTSYEGVLTPGSIGTVRDHPELRRQFGEMLESDRTAVYRYEGNMEPTMVTIIDDTTAACNHGPGGPQMEAVITDDEEFHSWAKSYFEAIRDEATPLQIGAFDP